MGGRPRKPTKLLLLNGAQRRNPGRLKDRAEKDGSGTWRESVESVPGLGDPPDYFDEADKARWAELIEITPAGILTRMDRPAAEQLCRLWAKFRRNECNVAESRLLATLFGKFGLTPSERSKVGAPGAAKKKPPANPFGQLG